LISEARFAHYEPVLEGRKNTPDQFSRYDPVLEDQTAASIRQSKRERTPAKRSLENTNRTHTQNRRLEEKKDTDRQLERMEEVRH